jgi:prevent-host-death family protein
LTLSPFLVHNSFMAVTVNVQDAEKQFEKWLERVALGEEITVTKAGEPVAKLVPVNKRQKRVPGGAEGLKVPPEFFEPLPNDIMHYFEDK